MTTVYCTSSDIKTWLGITDTADDASLVTAITVASRMVDNYCSTFFYLDAAPSARAFTPTSTTHLDTPPIATTSGMTVTVDDNNDGVYETTYTLDTDFVILPTGGFDATGRTVPYKRLQTLYPQTFPLHTRPSVQVTAQWGWASVPDEVAQATLIQAARIFRRRFTPEGFAAGEAFGAIRVSSRVDPDVAMLLTPFRSVKAMLA